MKRILSLIIALAMITTTAALVSCSDKDSTDTDKTTDSNTTSQPTTDATADKTVEFNPFPNLGNDDFVKPTDYVYDDYSPYLNIPDISTITFSWDDVLESYDEYVAEMLDSLSGTIFKECEEGTAIQEGYRATIYYTGVPTEIELDESALAGMTNSDDETGYGLVIGSGAFIGAYESEDNPEKNNAGFEEQLIGAKAGDTVSVTVTFPDYYPSNTDLQGQVVVFTVQIVSVEYPDDPTELTDELIAEVTGEEFTDVASFEEYIKNYFKGQVAYSTIYDSIEVIAYPTDDLNAYIEDYVQSYIDYYGEDSVSEEDLAKVRSEAEEEAKTSISGRLIDNYLFSYYDIYLTKSEYIAYVEENYENYSAQYYYYYGISNTTELEEYFGQSYLVGEFSYRKLVDQLRDLVVFDNQN